MLDTEQERRLDNALGYLRIQRYTGHVLCFQCGDHWFHPEHMPFACKKCHFQYDDGGQWCRPDFILENGDKKAVVFVNGEVHGKKKQRSKDKYQIQTIQLLNYKVFVINNDQIDYATVSWLRMAAWTMFLAVVDDLLYKKIYNGEREYPCVLV